MCIRWSEKLLLVACWLWAWAACLAAVPSPAGDVLSPIPAAAYPRITSVEWESADLTAGGVALWPRSRSAAPAPARGQTPCRADAADRRCGWQSRDTGLSQRGNLQPPDRGGNGRVLFTVNLGDMLFGSVQVTAEIVAGGSPVSATSRVAAVGLRKRLDLAGPWSVAGIEVLPARRRCPKDWKMPALPGQIVQPGRLPVDEGFRVGLH